MLAFSNNNSSRTLSNKASLIFLLSISTLILLTTYHILKTGRLHWLLEDGHVFASTGTTTTTHQLARQLSATELLERPLATNFTAVPRLIHQSWMNDELPAKFQKWSDGCRSAHPDWEWVLWTDEDNLALVRRYAPWFLGTYQSLEKEIYRADAVRNIYMHVFGGVYIDLDMECLRSTDSLLESYNMSSAAHDQVSPSASLGETALSGRKALLGRMGSDEKYVHSIPNAWMLSTPGHPFWLLPLESIPKTLGGKTFPEQLTGPIALFREVMRYHSLHGKGSQPRIDEHYAKSPWKDLFAGSGNQSQADLVILPSWEIYPYSWWTEGGNYREVCALGQTTFDAERCKYLLAVDRWGSHAVTYWSHSWDTVEGEAHSEEAMEAIS